MQQVRRNLYMNAFQKFNRYSVLGIILASFYPIYMGVKVVSEYITKGSVDVADYPKYIIPYTPISIALIITIALIPPAIRFLKQYAHLGISALGIGLFFAVEFWFENMVVLNGTGRTNIKNWQMLSCAMTPQTLKRAGNILAGEYSPAFKIHFYIISIVVILAVLNCVLGFAVMIKTNRYERKKPLILQAISAAIFIGLCILACFTAFFRTGQLRVSPVSAALMSLFFIVFGVTVGIYAGSFFHKKKKLLSVIFPAILSLATTTIMYVGELILLNGSLYQFGNGFLFEPLGMFPFATIDLLVILLSGIATYSLLSKFASAVSQ